MDLGNTHTQIQKHVFVCMYKLFLSVYKSMKLWHNISITLIVTSWNYTIIFVLFKIFHIAEVFIVNMYNFNNRREKQNLLPIHSPTHMVRSHFTKHPTLLTGSEPSQDMRGCLADQMLKLSNHGLPFCKTMRF